MNDVANKYEIPAKLAWEEKVYSALKPSISFFFWRAEHSTYHNVVRHVQLTKANKYHFTLNIVVFILKL